MAIHKTEAIVLRTTKLRETSYIVTFFSRDFGKFQAVAKGVRQPGSPWAGLYEPLNRLEIIFYEKFKSDIHLATEAFGLDLRVELRKNLKATTYGYYLTEVLESFSNPAEPSEEHWQLIESAYSLLPKSPVIVSIVFQLKVLQESGFFPDLVSVKESEGSEGLLGYFSNYLLELFKKTDSRTIFNRKPELENVQLLQYFKYLLKEGWDKAFRVQMDEKTLLQGESVLAWLISQKLDKNLRSRNFLEELIAI